MRLYNSELDSIDALPEWTTIYRDSIPPSYWLVLGKLLEKWPRDVFVLEIGAGAGDVLALLLFLGFFNSCGIERDNVLAEIANRKLEHFFNERHKVLFNSYPLQLKRSPDIIIQTNCVYHEGLNTKEEYLARQRNWMFFNGVPRLYALETLDTAYISPKYPEFVHVSETEMRSFFPDCLVSSYPTYQYPNNASTKRLYLIEPLGEI